ncbi:hypothetical protein YE0507 [Yersinia enterocolitica subsp. enterocolitica 8081]|uniref:Uncharacterized protein n=1 Tax=Yersinia enterocolitica serotype O:8 / biotype 1B (strain NCTC 13174 / 8081) TaxID=393305 RepID=A1JJ35_YERE8|nr:hypothetical protein YE0507 [Yersinia enterocolitica subsp. enterocolitica 8081]
MQDIYYSDDFTVRTIILKNLHAFNFWLNYQFIIIVLVECIE